MASIQQFSDLIVWQKSQELFTLIYSDWKHNQERWFREQLLRATLSISNNIAEGFERRGRKEFLQFLNIAKGSAGEVKSMLIIACKSNLITDSKNLDDSLSLIEEICRMLQGLVNAINSKPEIARESSSPYNSVDVLHDFEAFETTSPAPL